MVSSIFFVIGLEHHCHNRHQFVAGRKYSCLQCAWAGPDTGAKGFPQIETIRLNRSHLSWVLGFFRIHSSAAPSGFDQVHIQAQYCCGPSNFVQ